MAGTVYDYKVKTIECTNCGAPITGTLAGGRVTCEYCSAVLVISPRVREQRTATTIDEKTRIAGMWAQLEADHPSNPLRLQVPEGLEHIDSMLREPASRPAGLQAYRQEWERARQAVAGSASPGLAQTTGLFRIATRLEMIYHQDGEHRRARAVLETALDLLPSPDQRDIVRCRLAREALRLGDTAAFAAWMRDVDPRSIRLEVDTEYRCSMALQALQQQDHDAVLGLLGANRAAVPLAPHELAPCLRAHALAGTGRRGEAEHEIRLATRELGLDMVERIWSSTLGPSSAFAKTVAREAIRDALDPTTADPGGLGRAARRAPTATQATARRGRLLGLIAVPLALALIVGYLVVPVCPMLGGGGEPFELVMDLVRRCPEARMALGGEVTWASGLSSGGCGHGPGQSGAWSMKVKGKRRRGALRFSGAAEDGVWVIRTATLRVEGLKPIDLTTCTRAGAPARPGAPGPR